MLSSTGKPGGARTGDQMADYPIEGGRFLQACETLLTQEFKISWYDRFPSFQAFTAGQHNYTNNLDLPAGKVDAGGCSAAPRAERIYLHVMPLSVKLAGIALVPL